jgi:hypothetical protein
MVLFRMLFPLVWSIVIANLIPVRPPLPPSFKPVGRDKSNLRANFLKKRWTAGNGMEKEGIVDKSCEGEHWFFLH